MERRNVSVAGIDWAAQPRDESASGLASSTESSGAFGRFFRNFLIFLVCDIPYGAIVIGVASRVPNVDFELLGYGLTGAFLRFSVVLALLTAKPIFMPDRLTPTRVRTLWIIGFVAPPVACLILLLVIVFHLEPVVSALFWPLVILLLVYGWWRDRKKKSEVKTA
jgi:hypothetical protein